jgi:integrase
MNQSVKSRPIKLALNAAVVAGIEAEDDRVTVHDTKAPGLCITVTPTGHRAWYFYGRVGGRPRRIKLGTFPVMTTEQARKRALSIGGAVAEGRSVAGAKRAHKGEVTFGELFEHYLALPHRRTKRPRRDATTAEYRRLWSAHLERWSKRSLSGITRDDVAELHAAFGRRGAFHAGNRALALIRAMYGAAIGLGYTGPDPTAGVTKYAERARDRFIDREEMPRLLAALEADGSAMADFALVLMFTASRRRPAEAMKWDDVDLELALWRIPETKGGEPLTIPLSAPVLAVVKRRRAAVPLGVRWVFPSVKAGGGHLTEPIPWWNAITKRLGIAGVRLHDLRRTCASFATMAGVPHSVVKAMLGHALDPRDITSVYSRFDAATLREGFERAATAMLATVPTAPIKQPRPRKRKGGG